MKVTSPVGDYDYEVRSVALRRDGHIVVAGNLGVWETTMEVEPSDWLRLARRLRRPAAVIAGVAAAGAMLRRAR
jgi:hypothetical protein